MRIDSNLSLQHRISYDGGITVDDVDVDQMMPDAESDELPPIAYHPQLMRQHDGTASIVYVQY